MPTPHIEYPSEWRYRLIGRSTEAIQEVVAEVVGARPHQLEPGRESRGGRYVSMTLSLTVESEADRLGLSERLSAADAIQLVL